MKIVLKKNSSDFSWKQVWDNPHKYVSRAELKQITAIAIERIRVQLSEWGPKACVGYSGGKDSIVVYEIAKKIKIQDGMYVHSTSDWFFHEFNDWMAENLPSKVEMMMPGLGWNWLERKSPRLLFYRSRFPKSEHSKILAPRLQMKWKSQGAWLNAGGYDFMIMGRRTSDHNIVGAGGCSESMGNKIKVCNPIHDWPHEAVIAFLVHHGLTISPTYFYERGFFLGLMPWIVTSKEYMMKYGPDIYEKFEPRIKRILKNG